MLPQSWAEQLRYDPVGHKAAAELSHMPIGKLLAFLGQACADQDFGVYPPELRIKA